MKLAGFIFTIVAAQQGCLKKCAQTWQTDVQDCAEHSTTSLDSIFKHLLNNLLFQIIYLTFVAL